LKYLNHVTLNTGHVRQTYPGEVDKRLFFRLKRILNDSFRPEGAELINGYRLKSTQIEVATIATIFALDGAPILTTACSKQDDGTIWRMLHETTNEPLKTKASDPVPVPYIADRLEIGVMAHMDALKWTGDFSRCFGWMVLDPYKIR